jgi:uncharacterized protein YdeI (YjbR/CyaY-like superfamily)
MPRDDLPILSFPSQASWEAWLAKHHAKSQGIYLKIAKKDSGARSVNYQQALEGALCYGWIDGLKQPLNQDYWLQRFTPRRPRSKWSQINCNKVTVLEQAGKLKPPGVQQVEAAKQDGRWERAYAPASSATIPADLRIALAAAPKAKAHFARLSASWRYRILYRIHEVKRPETRVRRIAQLVQRLASDEPLR